jgi:hypothetical protein
LVEAGNNQELDCFDQNFKVANPRFRFEIEIPEFNAYVVAGRVASALERRSLQTCSFLGSEPGYGSERLGRGNRDKRQTQNREPV